MTSWHNYVHPDIAMVMNPLRTLMQAKLSDGGKVSMSKLLELDGKTMKDHCPKCNANDSDGRRGLCWNFTLGRCAMGKKCRHVHAFPNAIPNNVVSDIVAAITPGVAIQVEEMESMQDTKRAKTVPAGGTAGPTVTFS